MKQAGAELCQAQISRSYLLPTFFLAYLLTKLLTYMFAYLLDCFLACFLGCLIDWLLGYLCPCLPHCLFSLLSEGPLYPSHHIRVLQHSVLHIAQQGYQTRQV